MKGEETYMDILLVHGLGRTVYSMKSLGRYLERQGHQVHYFGYAAFAESYERIVMRLRTRLHKISGDSLRPYAIVAHSLGGILSRSALATKAEAATSVANVPPKILAPKVLVMLGPPNQSPRAARWAWRVPPFQWFARDCGHKLATPAFYAQLPLPHYPYRIIAGTFGWTGFGSPFGMAINDGLVALEETVIKQDDRDSTASNFRLDRSGLGDAGTGQPMTFPVFHSFMMNDGAVQAAVVCCLAEV